MDAASLYETYLGSYSPERFMNFYHSMAEELFLLANPSRVIPFSQAPLILDRRFQDLFTRMASSVWKVLENRVYRQVCAETVPDVLVETSREKHGALAFDPACNIGGIDLHIEQDRLRLIEFMVLPPGMSGIYPRMLALYQNYLETCCSGYRPDCFRPGWNRERVEETMIRNIVGDAQPERVAVIDWEPQSQITYGEFLYILDRLHKTRGIPGLIADPREVSVKGGKIRVRGEVVDRIYNRLTLIDWYNHAEAISAYTRLLWESPESFVYHPYLWFLGDKNSLVLLSDPAALDRMGLDEAHRKAIEDLVPKTLRLSDFSRPEGRGVDTDRLLSSFRSPSEIVFKPTSSHASNGILFGPVDTPDLDSLERVLRDVDPETTVAMDLVPPPEIEVSRGDGRRETWKYDLRVFVLNGEHVFSGGRIYLGDYTNQVPCRGFAPLFFV